MKVNFRVLEVSVIDTHPTNYMGQIKMDFHHFDSSTVKYNLYLILKPALHTITHLKMCDMTHQNNFKYPVL